MMCDKGQTREEDDNTAGEKAQDKKVQCIPRYVRNLAWLSCRVMPGDAAEGLG